MPHTPPDTIVRDNSRPAEGRVYGEKRRGYVADGIFFAQTAPHVVVRAPLAKVQGLRFLDNGER